MDYGGEEGEWVVGGFQILFAQAELANAQVEVLSARVVLLSAQAGVLSAQAVVLMLLSSRHFYPPRINPNLCCFCSIFHRAHF